MCGSSWENMVKAWGNHWETKNMGKTWGSHGETAGKSCRKHGKNWEEIMWKIMGKNSWRS